MIFTYILSYFVVYSHVKKKVFHHIDGRALKAFGCWIGIIYIYMSPCVEGVSIKEKTISLVLS